MTIRLAALCVLADVAAPIAADCVEGRPAQEVPAQELTNTKAFERAYGTSFYEFDACGDGLTGRLFRKALTDKVAQCPFSAEARATFSTRAAAMRTKSSAAIESMIGSNGGLPVQLEGMPVTCREQRNSETFQRLAEALKQYAGGQRSVDAVIPAKCDAADILP